MKFNGPFLFVNEKNKYKINIESVDLNFAAEYNLLDIGVCSIIFKFNSNITEFDLDQMFNIQKLFNSDGRMPSKRDIASDFKLFEYFNGKWVLSLELKNGFIKEYNLNNHFCEVYFDWYIVSNESRMFNKIHDIREAQEKLFKENFDRLKNQPPIGSIEWLTNTNRRKPNYENDNESIWKHNIKHSFLPWNWFKRHNTRRNFRLALKHDTFYIY